MFKCLKDVNQTNTLAKIFHSLSFDKSAFRSSWVVLVIRNPPANAGDTRDMGPVPGLGRSLAEGNIYPLQYSCLENPMGRGAWWTIVQEVTKSWTGLSMSDFGKLTFTWSKSPGSSLEHGSSGRYDPWCKAHPMSVVYILSLCPEKTAPWPLDGRDDVLMVGMKERILIQAMKNKRCLFLSFWLTSFCKTGFRFVHLMRTDSNTFLFIAEQYSILCIYRIFFIHSSVGGHLGCFPILATVNSAAVNTRIEDPPEKGMATHSSILAWRIPWKEEPGGLQSLGLQRVGHESC